MVQSQVQFIISEHLLGLGDLLPRGVAGRVRVVHLERREDGIFVAVVHADAVEGY